MMDKTRVTVAILVSSVVLGFAGDSLLRVGPWGYNIVVWIGLLLGIIYTLAASYKTDCFKNVKWFAIPLIIFSVGLALRDSSELRFLNLLGIVATLGIVMMRSNMGGYLRASVSDYLVNWIGHIVLGLVKFFYLFGIDVSWKDVTNTEHGERYKSISRGLLIALPLLCVFGELMVSADAVFKKYTVDLIHLDAERIATALLLIPLFTWIGGAILRQLLMADPPAPPVIVDKPEGFKLGRIELGIVFGTIVTLFLGFIIVQFGYFFGGNEHVLQTLNLTYADYARSGFFELVTVCGIAIIVVLSLQATTRQSDPTTRKMFTIMSSLFIGELVIVLISASQRMGLYVNAYGMSILRFFVAVIIVWLAVVMLWLSITQIANRSRYFAFGALLTAFIAVWVSVGLNPDKMIAEYNLKMNGKLDIGYICSLSADAVPSIVNHIKELPKDKQQKAAGKVLEKWPTSEFSDWRSMNFGRSDAAWSIHDNRQQLQIWGKGYQPDRYDNMSRADDWEAR